MKNTIISLILFTCFLGTESIAQTLPAYQLFNAKGKRVSHEKMMKFLEKSDVILFGEQHNNPVSHWLQLEVTQQLLENHDLVLGAEMIESDNQEVLNLYLTDSIEQKGLDTLARLWRNHKTDYKPLVDLAKKRKLPFVASNIPRRYAKMVHKGGLKALDRLPENEKAWIAPLPIAFDAELPTYQSILQMMGDHGTPELVKAQAIKDATMAHFILQNLKSETIFMHYNGSFHSNYYEGILWYLKRENNELNYATISTVTQDETRKLNEEHIGKADFIICVDEQMTKTY